MIPKELPLKIAVNLHSVMRFVATVHGLDNRIIILKNIAQQDKVFFSKGLRMCLVSFLTETPPRNIYMNLYQNV